MTGHRERGMILVAVLLAVAIMSVMVVAATALTRAGIGNERLEQRRLNSHLALRSGIEAAKAQILATPPDQRLLLGGTETRLDLGDGVSATVNLRDAAGLVDLNRSDPALIESVARFAGLSGNTAKNLASLIVDLRKKAEPAGADAKADVQATPAASNAAQPKPTLPKPAQPAALPKPAQDDGNSQPPAPMIFLGVDQLSGLFGLDAGDARRLAAVFTVFNPTGAINPLAAPEQVLAAVPGLSSRDAADIAAARRSPAAAKDPRLQQLIQRAKGMLELKDPSVFIIEVTLDEGPGVLAGSRAMAVVRLQQNAALPFGTLALEEM